MEKVEDGEEARKEVGNIIPVTSALLLYYMLLLWKEVSLRFLG